MKTKNCILFYLLTVTFQFSFSQSKNTDIAAKGYRSAQVELLKKRGLPETYKGSELHLIGMPIGGLTCGQVYLGGDGKLWYWDIFNKNRINPNNVGAGDKYYLSPMVQDHQFEQGFAINIRRGNSIQSKQLASGGFSDISFRGEYPMGKVFYKDATIPLDVELNAFSPFVPTNFENSEYPAVVLEYTITNNSKKTMTFDFVGWLQNTSNYFSAKQSTGKHINTIAREGDLLFLNTYSEVEEADKDNADYGNMTLALLDAHSSNTWGTPKTTNDINYNSGAIKQPRKQLNKSETTIGNKHIGALGKTVTIGPNKHAVVTYVLSWYFPNFHKRKMGQLKGHQNLRNHYTKKFTSSTDVAKKINKKQDVLIGATKDWNATWYNSTLPYWFLDRSFINTSTLATTSVFRFDDITDNIHNENRFYALEGVGLGPGSCTHVFHYEQALGRLFPNLSRQYRQQTDFGLSWDKKGFVRYRGEFNIGKHAGDAYAIDGHAGTLLRAYREHTTSNNNTFLETNWTKIKAGIQHLMNQDKYFDGVLDGIIEGAQYNTLDKIWMGKNAWITGLYNSVLLAGKEMALEMNDKKFAKLCEKTAKSGAINMSTQLFNGEYFMNIEGKHFETSPNSNKGCHIDQLLGQSWAKQVGLPNITNNNNIKKGLKSIFRYNFQKDVGEYLDNAKIKNLRYFALPGESGTIMTTFPRGGEDIAPGLILSEWDFITSGYFSESMTGFTYQVISNMIAEGLVDEALIMMKAIHDRYTPNKRNPYNEVEYGNHYIRAMASYGTFISMTGFTYHGPKKSIGFAPKITPKKFKSAFTAAEGWGSFEQERLPNSQKNFIELIYGQLYLKEINLEIEPKKIAKIEVYAGEQFVKAKYKVANSTSLKITLSKDVNLKKGDELKVLIKYKN